MTKIIERKNKNSRREKRRGKSYSSIEECAAICRADHSNATLLLTVRSNRGGSEFEQCDIQQKQQNQEPPVTFCSIYYSNGSLKYEGYVLKCNELETENSQMCESSKANNETIVTTLKVVKHGHGIHIDQNGNRYEGGFQNNKRHGWGNYIFYPSGNTYRGEFYDGSFNGYGTHVWRVVVFKNCIDRSSFQRFNGGANARSYQRRSKSFDSSNSSSRNNYVEECSCRQQTTLNDIYQGQWKDNQMHGYGTKTLHNGDSYEGYWKESAAHGWGKKLFASSGECHEGMYEKDKREGFGIYTWSNGDTYEGQWHKGMRHGRGVQRFANCDDKYEGDFEYDVAQGYGCKSFGSAETNLAFNEREYVGNFYNNVRHGYGTFTWDNLWHVRTTVYVGNWNDNAIEGQGVLTIHQWDSLAPFRPMYDGEFSNEGVPHGIGIMRYSNGDTYTGQFENGLRSGHGSYKWHDSQNSVTGTFAQNALCGPYTVFDHNGMELLRAEWNQGQWIISRSIVYNEIGGTEVDHDGFQEISSEGQNHRIQGESDNDDTLLEITNDTFLEGSDGEIENDNDTDMKRSGRQRNGLTKQRKTTQITGSGRILWRVRTRGRGRRRT